MNVDKLRAYFGESARVSDAFAAANAEDVVDTGRRIKDDLAAGRRMLVCGNGGSAADAQHFAAEITCRFEKERRPYPVLALGTNISEVTAWSNDYNFEGVFARQVEAFGSKGDTLLAISTSGNSRDVIKAVAQAKRQGLYTIGLLGKSGGELKDLVDRAIVVASDRTAHVQECHVMIYHFWCEMIEA